MEIKPKGWKELNNVTAYTRYLNLKLEAAENEVDLLKDELAQQKLANMS